MKKTNRIVAILLAIIFCFSVVATALTPEEMTPSLQQWLANNINVAEVLDGNVIDSQLDWTVFSMTRSGNKKYVNEYKAYIGKALKAHSDELFLADFARISLAAMSVGLDPKDLGGINLLEKIENTGFTKEIYTGGLAYALLTLESASYAPKAQESIIDIIISSQRADGGFNAFVEVNEDAAWTINGEPDSTGIMLQAFAPFKDRDNVKSSINKAVDYIKNAQLETAGFGIWGDSAESTSMIVAGLCELGISPTADEFKKNGKTMFDSLSTFINEDGGGRCWDGSSNIMTSYQMLLALNSYDRFKNNRTGLFELTKLDEVKNDIRTSVIGKYLPRFADFICKIVDYFYNLFSLNRYIQP